MKYQLTGHSQRITWVEFDQTGKYLATTSKDGSVFVWSYHREPGWFFHRPHRFSKRYEFTGHVDGAFSASFNHDSTKLAVSQGNGDIKVWQLETLEDVIDRGCAWLSDSYFETHGHEEEVQDLIENCS